MRAPVSQSLSRWPNVEVVGRLSASMTYRHRRVAELVRQDGGTHCLASHPDIPFLICSTETVPAGGRGGIAAMTASEYSSSGMIVSV